MSSLLTRQRSLAALTASQTPTLKRRRLLRQSGCGLVRRLAWSDQRVCRRAGSVQLCEFVFPARVFAGNTRVTVSQDSGYSVALKATAGCAAKAYLQQLRQARAEDRGDVSGACAAPSQPLLAWLKCATDFRRERPRCCRRTQLPAGAQATTMKQMRPWRSTCASRRRRCASRGLFPSGRSGLPVLLTWTVST